MTSRQLILSFTLLVVTPSLAFGEAQCPGNAETVRYHSLQGSQIAIDVVVNGSGPYEFMVDTGSQISTIDPSLATELGLKPLASVAVTDVSSSSRPSVARLDSLAANRLAVTKPLIVIQELARFQAVSPSLRGIIGLNFLAHFDILIDYGHKVLCLDETEGLRKSIDGEHIPVVSQPSRQNEPSFTEPLLIPVHLSGKDSREAILNLDSGVSLPLLFAGRSETPGWLADKKPVQVSTTSGQRAFSVVPAQDIRVGKRSVSHVVFVTPSSMANFPKVMEDGLLPTSLFNRVFISYADHFVVFDPR